MARGNNGSSDCVVVRPWLTGVFVEDGKSLADNLRDAVSRAREIQ